MREQKIDIDLTLKWEQVVSAGGFEACMHDVLRIAKSQAEERAREVGGEVRNTVMPEIVVREGVSPLLGNVFMIGTRWVCDVPESAFTPSER